MRISQDIDQKEKECSFCHHIKPASDYHILRREGRTPCLYSRCKTCHSLSAARWTKANRDRVNQNTRRNHRKWNYNAKRYGLSPAQFEEMKQTQNDCCAICGKPERIIMQGRRKRLSIDHNHKTQAVRELLCNSCNHLIGDCLEDTTILANAIEYLNKHNGVRSA